MQMNRNQLRRAFRLGFGVVIVEGVIYFLEMLIVASRLHGGVATGTAHAAGRIFGLQAFTAVRHGYHSEVNSASWVVPAMIVLPLVVGAIAYLLPTQRGGGGMRAHALGTE
jgi:hypothetical protein